MMDIRKIRCTVPCQVEEAKSGCHCAEARAEIERLRAGGCARDQGTTQYCAEAAAKDAEIASLLNLLADARTENMRLRAALLAFADHFGPLEGNPFLHEDALRCFALARAALDEGRT